MRPPRSAAHKFALLMFLSACHTWRPITVAGHTGFQTRNVVRVERRLPSADPVAGSANGTASVAHARLVLKGAWVNGDSLFGNRSGSATPIVMPVADVVRVRERRLSGPRTALLVSGVAVGGFIALLALALGSAGGVGY